MELRPIVELMNSDGLWLSIKLSIACGLSLWNRVAVAWMWISYKGNKKNHYLPLSLSCEFLLTKDICGLNISSRAGVVWHDSVLKQLTRKQVSVDLNATSQAAFWQHRLIHISKSPTSPMFVKFPAFFPRSKVRSSVVFPAMQTGARCLRCFFPVADGQKL